MNGQVEAALIQIITQYSLIAKGCKETSCTHTHTHRHTHTQWKRTVPIVTSSDLGGMSVKASWAAFTAGKHKKTGQKTSTTICFSLYQCCSYRLSFAGWTNKFQPRFQKSSFLRFFSWYWMAALRLKASIRAVWCRTSVLPTLWTSIPSVVIPTLSSSTQENKVGQKDHQKCNTHISLQYDCWNKTG